MKRQKLSTEKQVGEATTVIEKDEKDRQSKRRIDLEVGPVIRRSPTSLIN